MIERYVIERIISGGQQGVDQAALRAARSLGIATGGCAPKGWRTLDGPAPWLAEFGLVEHPWSCGYPPRTEENVKQSDATLRIALDFRSPGERCTARFLEKHGKPSMDVQLVRANGALLVAQVHSGGACSGGGDAVAGRVAEWLRTFRVLNVAGNSEKSEPGIGLVAERFLVDVFQRCR